MGYAATFNQIYILRGIMGFSEAFYIPAALSLIADYHQEKTRSFAIAIHTTGIYLGQALGGFGATISKYFSWHFSFHSVGLFGVLYSFILIFFIQEKKTYFLDHTKKSSVGNEFKQMFKGLGILFGNISFWVLLFYFSVPSFFLLVFSESGLPKNNSLALTPFYMKVFLFIMLSVCHKRY